MEMSLTGSYTLKKDLGNISEHINVKLVSASRRSSSLFDILPGSQSSNVFLSVEFFLSVFFPIWSIFVTSSQKIT